MPGPGGAPPGTAWCAAVGAAVLGRGRGQALPAGDGAARAVPAGARRGPAAARAAARDLPRPARPARRARTRRRPARRRRGAGGSRDQARPDRGRRLRHAVPRARGASSPPRAGWRPWPGPAHRACPGRWWRRTARPNGRPTLPYQRVEAEPGTGRAVIVSIGPDETLSRAVYRLDAGQIDLTSGVPADRRPPRHLPRPRRVRRRPAPNPVPPRLAPAPAPPPPPVVPAGLQRPSRGRQPRSGEMSRTSGVSAIATMHL